MRLTFKILCFLLTITMLLPLFCGCITLPPNDKLPPDDQGTAPPEEITSQTIDLSGYTLIRPTECSSELAKAASEFLTEINNATGANMLLKEDFIPAGTEVDPAAKEILVGYTNREESKAALEEMGDQFSFSIQVKDNKIIVLGATAELTVKGIQFLYEQYLPRANGNGTLTVPKSYISHPQNYQEIITNGVFNYELVYSILDKNSTNFMAISELMDAINAHASEPIVIHDDWIQSGASHDLSKKAIVVGATSYPRSSELLANTDFFGWALSMEENQIYAAAYEADALSAVCKNLKNRIDSGILWGKEGKTLRICRESNPIYGSLKAWNQSIPDYESGTMQSLREVTPNHYRLYYTSTNRSAYDDYVEKLENEGFALYGANTLEDNVFKTYFKDDLMLHVYYVASKRATSIIMVPANEIERYPLSPVSNGASANITPTLTLMNMNYSSQKSGNNGMGFVYTLEDGSFVIIDGGYAAEAEKLYNFMAANSEDGIPHIRAWIITHPDEDHYGCFEKFASLYASNTTLDYFVAQFDYLKIKNGDIADTVDAIMKGVDMFESCKTIVPLTGQQMYFGTLKVDFLYAPDSFHNTEILATNNEHSLVMRTYFEEKTILYMADVMSYGLKWVTDSYDTTLKCDYMQAPHHGLNGNEALYNRALPEYLILCTNDTNAQSRLQLTNNGLSQLMQKKLPNGDPVVKQVFAADHSYTTLIPNEQANSTGVPELSGGTLTSVKEFTPGYYRYYYTNCTLDTYNAYLNKLTDNGFELYGTNTIDANVYNTYYKDSLMLHVYYLNATGTVSVLTTDALNAISYPKEPVSDGEVTTPSFAMMDMDYDSQSGGKNNGMGFVFTLADGSYVIIDGGYATEAEGLYQYLVKNNKRADGKILIRAWIITHPDGDHYGCFLQFARKHASHVTLEYLVAQFDQDRINSGAIEGIVNAVYAAQRKFSGSRRLVPLIGQKMYFGDLELEFLFTAEALHPTVVNYNNEHSLVIKTEFCEKTILLSADVVGVSISWLTRHYTDALDCDIFQTPHHGLNGSIALYDRMNPQYLLMCTHQTASDQRLTNQHAHGRQSLLYYLLLKGNVKYAFAADNSIDGFIPIMNGTTVLAPTTNT